MNTEERKDVCRRREEGKWKEIAREKGAWWRSEDGSGRKEEEGKNEEGEREREEDEKRE